MKVLLPLVVAMFVLALASAEPPKKPGKGPPLPEADAKALEKINAVRKLAGVGPVTIDAKMSAGCSSHAAYLLKHYDAMMKAGTSMHSEDPKLEGYTKEGAAAGKASDIHYVEPAEAVDGFMASLYHRIPLLNADLQKIGLGYVKGTANPPWVCCVDVLSGLPPLTEEKAKVVMYPADGQKDVPLDFGGERPTPIPDDPDQKAGFPVTATFREIVKVTDATATLKDAAGVEVPVWLSTPEKTVQPQGQRNTIGLIAKDPLKPATTYTVTVDAKVDGKAWKKAWKFTTRK
ncbi:MAG: CAP domain-containing protein [Planctomycetota bacterium]|mgnify:FL=1